MKKLIAVFTIFVQVGFLSLPVYASKGTIIKGDVLDGFENILVNPSVERASCTNGWTVGPTSACDGTNLAPGQGRQSVQLTLSTSSGALFYQDVTPIHQFGSTNMEAGLWVKTSTSGLQVCPRSGGTVLTAQCVSVPATGTWQPVSANMIGPASGTVGVALYAPSSIASGTVNVDGAYVGRARNLSQVSQAQLLGTVTITGCSGAWSTTSTSFGAWTTIPTGCSYAVTGQAQAPAANTVGITFPSIGPGEYALQYEGAYGQQGAAGNVAYYQFWDGTNSAREQSAYTNGGGNGTQSTMNQSISYTTAQSNVTFSIRAKNSSATTPAAQVFGTTSLPGVIKVYYYPSQSQLALRADQTPASWSGAQSGAYWSVTATAANTFYDFTSSSASTTLTPRTSRNITCSNGASISTIPSLTCTLPKQGNYEVCATTTGQDNSGAGQWGFKLVDGSGAVINDVSTGISASAGNSASTTMCGHYSYSGTSAPTFKIQAANTSAGHVVILGGAAGVIQSSVVWKITELDAPMPAPYLVGSVTSNTQGQERVERARISVTSSTACSVVSQSGSWISTATGGATQCALAFTGGMFSGAPSCSCTTDASAGTNTWCRWVGSAGRPTTSGLTFVSTDTTNSLHLDTVDIICQGPR